MANTSIRLKSSGVSGNVPTQLLHGELAINYADGKIFYLDSDDTISFIQTTGGSSDSFANINANSTLISAASPTDTLTFIAGNNVNISTNTLNKSITIEAITGSVDGFPLVDLGFITEDVYDNNFLDLGTL
jgi:hypothetical protein